MIIYIIGPYANNAQRSKHYEAKTFLRSENHRSIFLEEGLKSQINDTPIKHLICAATNEALECDALYLLKGWKADDLSCIMHNMFDQLGKQIFYEISNFSPAKCSTDITQIKTFIHN